MRRQTPFTVDEAKAYIIESVKVWEESSEPKEVDKIISLAGTAYNRRNKAATNSPAKRMSDLQKNIKALELVIKRNTKNTIQSPNLEKSLEVIKTLYNELVAEHGEPKPKKPTK